MGALLLEWLRRGVLTLRMQGGAPAFVLPPARALSPEEAGLYAALCCAAGPGGVLEAGEFAAWARANAPRVEALLQQYADVGIYTLHHTGAVQTRLAFVPGQSARKSELAARPLPPPTAPGAQALPHQQHAAGHGLLAYVLRVNTNVYFTAAGRTALNHMYGYKRYLQQYTLLNQRTPPEVQLWQRSLVYAHLFGNAATVAAAFKTSCPAAFTPGSLPENMVAAATSGLLASFDKSLFNILAHSYKNHPLSRR